MNTLLTDLPTLVYIGVCFLVWLLLSSASIRKLISILRTPTEIIGALPNEGLVEIAGKVGGKIINSPITQSACVLWQIEVEERRRSGKGGTHWSTIYKKLSEESFEVSDGTGRIQVLPDPKSELILNSDVLASNTSYEYDSRIQSALENLGIKTTGFLGFNRTLRVNERVIETGEQVYIHGHVNYDNGIKTIVTGRGAPLIISDQSEKSVLRALSWRVAGAGFFTALIGFILRDIGVGLLAQFLSVISVGK